MAEQQTSLVGRLTFVATLGGPLFGYQYHAVLGAAERRLSACEFLMNQFIDLLRGEV